MKKKWIVVVGIAVLLLAFFPYGTQNMISGTGTVLDAREEDGTLSITISKTRSLLFCYNMQFSYTYNGEKSKVPMSSSYAKTDDGYCLISQMYYDEEDDDIRLCSLYFKEDMSYALLCWDDRQILYGSAE